MIQNKFLDQNKIFILLFLILVSGCHSFQENHGHNIVYKNIIIEKAIVGFIESISQSSADSVLTVSLTNKSDTVILSIGNSYPDLSVTQFRGTDTVNNFRVIFVGDNNSEFYEINSSPEIPKDVLLKNENLKNFNNPPNGYDPKQWLFYFLHNNLISTYPREEINKFVLKTR